MSMLAAFFNAPHGTQVRFDLGVMRMSPDGDEIPAIKMTVNDDDHLLNQQEALFAAMMLELSMTLLTAPDEYADSMHELILMLREAAMKASRPRGVQ
jgi:hypothetical protein